jgi:hypothetical protein
VYEYRDKEWLASEYICKLKPAAVIAAECKCSDANIFRWLKRHGIKSRTGAGQFSDESEPWNKGMVGIHLSPETEFKRGGTPNNHCNVGETTVRKDRNGNLRAYVKIAEPNKWQPRAVINWEMVNGPVPKDTVLHHKDRNTLNDAIENLEPLSRAKHLNEHRSEFNKLR